MFKLNKKAEGSVGTAIKLVISIVLGGAILFSTTAMVNNTVVPGMVNIFESEHSEGVAVSGDATSAEIDDAIVDDPPISVKEGGLIKVTGRSN